MSHATPGQQNRPKVLTDKRLAALRAVADGNIYFSWPASAAPGSFRSKTTDVVDVRAFAWLRANGYIGLTTSQIPRQNEVVLRALGQEALTRV